MTPTGTYPPNGTTWIVTNNTITTQTITTQTIPTYATAEQRRAFGRHAEGTSGAPSRPILLCCSPCLARWRA
jgi:hypothetical protein